MRTTRWVIGAALAVLAVAFPVGVEAEGASLAITSMIYGTRDLNMERLFREGRRSQDRVQSKSLVAALRLAIEYSFTHADPTPGTELTDAAYRLWRMITVRGSYRGETVDFMNVVPRDLANFARFLDTALTPQTAPDFTSSAGAQETDLLTELELRFDAWGSDDPSSLGLPLGAITGLQVIADGGEPGDLMSGESETTSAAAFNGPSGSGDPDTDPSEERFLKRRRVPSALMTSHESYDVTKDASGRRLHLPEIEPQQEIARVMLVEELDAEYNSGIVTDVGLNLDGRQVFQKRPIEYHQRNNVRRYPGLGGSIPDGRVLFDFVKDGSFRELYSVRSEERPYLDVDLTHDSSGDNELRVVMQYVDRRAA